MQRCEQRRQQRLDDVGGSSLAQRLRRSVACSRRPSGCSHVVVVVVVIVVVVVVPAHGLVHLRLLLRLLLAHYLVVCLLRASASSALALDLRVTAVATGACA
jgi:hypothetical protein